jgi:hypothetical protein
VIASRSQQHAQRRAANTACPPRRSAGSSQAPTDRRRGQACTRNHQPTIAFGAESPTPALRAGVDNTVGFTAIADN